MPYKPVSLDNLKSGQRNLIENYRTYQRGGGRNILSSRTYGGYFSNALKRYKGNALNASRLKAVEYMDKMHSYLDEWDGNIPEIELEIISNNVKLKTYVQKKNSYKQMVLIGAYLKLLAESDNTINLQGTSADDFDSTSSFALAILNKVLDINAHNPMDLTSYQIFTDAYRTFCKVFETKYFIGYADINENSDFVLQAIINDGPP